MRWVNAHAAVPPAKQDDYSKDRMIPISIFPIPAEAAPLFQIIANLITLLQWSAIGICVIGPAKLWGLISSSPVPQVIRSMDESRWQLVASAFFLGNMVKGILTSSSAFEIYLGNRLVFSGLDAGRVPSVADIAAGLQRAGAVITD